MTAAKKAASGVFTSAKAQKTALSATNALQQRLSGEFDNPTVLADDAIDERIPQILSGKQKEFDALSNKGNLSNIFAE